MIMKIEDVIETLEKGFVKVKGTFQSKNMEYEFVAYRIKRVEGLKDMIRIDFKPLQKNEVIKNE